jgi:N-acyl-D-aspartate/D-glutamate deacylase
MDIVIRHGAVVDGTGKGTYEADVGIRDGQIVEIGKIAASGREEIDARGQIVTPGFVDIHTHYDAQATWDKHLTPSSWHGVTSTVIGNCGVGFAPCRPENRDRLIELMEGVEDIPGAALHEGLDWNWTSFGEFLDRLERNAYDIDIGVLLPHSPVRIHVMGERANWREQASDAEIAEMCQIARQAMRDGAFGFSTSRTSSHKTLAGEMIPTLRAREEELSRIAMAVSETGGGIIEAVSDWSPDAAAEFNMMTRIAERSGLNFLITLNQRHDRTEIWKDVLDLADKAAERGVPIRPVFPPRAVGIMFGLQGSQNPFSGCPSYRDIEHLPVAERARRMRDPNLRRKILSEDPRAQSTFPLMERIGYDWMFPFDASLDYEPPKEKSLKAIAEREGRTPPEVAYDLLTSDDGRNFILVNLVSYASYDLRFVEEMMKHRNALVGLSDGGAHVGFICDGGFPTFLLSYWGRDRAGAKFPLEELVRRQTSDTASAAGLHDRGVIAIGKKADVNVIDFDRLQAHRPYVVHDLPTGGKRFLQKATGYTATIKSGAISYRNGESTGLLNGRLMRGPATVR